MLFMAATMAGGAWAAGTITSITPNNGPLSPGTAITIRGTHFNDVGDVATGVTFGGVAGTAFSVVDGAHILVTTPISLTAGAVAVTINGPGASFPITLAGGFQYTNASLQVNVVARINSVIDISWNNGVALPQDQDSVAGVTHPLGNVKPFSWDVGGVPGGGLVPISTASTYILSQDFTVNVANQSTSTEVQMSSSVDAPKTTFGGAPATAGWTLVASPGGGTDQYSLTATLNGVTADLVGTLTPGTVVALGTINAGASQQLDLTYVTPTVVTIATSDVTQTTQVTLLATKF